MPLKSVLLIYTIVSTMLSNCKFLKMRGFSNFHERLLTMVNFMFYYFFADNFTC